MGKPKPMCVVRGPRHGCSKPLRPTDALRQHTDFRLDPPDHNAQFSTSIWEAPTQTQKPTFRCHDLELDHSPRAGFNCPNTCVCGCWRCHGVLLKRTTEPAGMRQDCSQSHVPLSAATAGGQLGHREALLMPTCRW